MEPVIQSSRDSVELPVIQKSQGSNQKMGIKEGVG